MENTKELNTKKQCDIHVVNYCLDHVKKGTYIAFGFNYNGGKPSEIIVDNVTSTNETKVLVHFMYGHHSLAEYVAKEDIIAIGNPKGKGKIRGWTGNFDILQPNHPLLKDCS
jgi:hypothetical protein